MTDTPNRPPLWVLLQDVHRSVAGSYFQNRDEVLGPPDCLTRAADIRAVRDWLIQQCRNEGIDQDARNSIYGMLTAEADRAERGDHD